MAIVGNGIFPQSSWAQGVLLADKMIQLVIYRRSTWENLLDNNPSDDLIIGMFGEARDKSHSAYKLKPTSEVMGGSIINVWRNDKESAMNFLSSLAQIINSDTPIREATTRHYRNRVLSEITADPEKTLLFKGLLQAASQSLSDETIKDLSRTYKKTIAEFMQKYAPNSFADIPNGYLKEQESLHKHLRSILQGATSLTQQQMLKFLEVGNSQHALLLEAIRNYDSDKLFGGVSVSHIHPLKHPDYQ